MDRYLVVDNKLLKDGCEYFGRDITEELKAASDKVAVAFSKWEGEVEDYYRHNEDYVLDDIAFNLQFDYYVRWLPLRYLKGRTIIDIGCGIGTIALALARMGNAVVGYDINECAIDFANFRKKKLGVDNVIFTTHKPDYTEFNCMMAIDVLEHIKDLRGFLVELGKETLPATQLYYCNAFKHKIPQHYDHSDRFDDYLAEAGFIPMRQLHRGHSWAVKKFTGGLNES